jgi:hypothetical protein
MRSFSKSKLVALHQCQKRFWLEVHRPQLREDSAATQASFQQGYRVGDIAQRIYDPQACGDVIDISAEGFERAFERSAELLRSPATKSVFEAGFSAGGALAFADVMLPIRKKGRRVWRMVEVKSSTSVKDYHLDDVAIQAFVAQSSGIELDSVSLAHIDSSWVYPGNGDYHGLLTEVDLTEHAFSRTAEVQGWIAQAQSTFKKKKAPQVTMGEHCTTPFACGFSEYCSQDLPKPEYPIHWLPRISAKKIQELASAQIDDMRYVTEDILNDVQQRVKHHTLADTVFFDARGAKEDLAGHSFPAYFLDFETIQFAVPTWKGTRPYQQITFQFSLHILNRNGELKHLEFLDISGKNPSKAFAQALIAGCKKQGPVFVYNAGFETARIKELALRYPALNEQLLAINARVVDLLPIARNRYYHPSQQGSWSIKKVLPAAVPELSYDALDGVQDGGMAMNAFLEAIDSNTSATRKTQIEQQLLAYCKLDTYAMVRLWQVFSGRTDLKL